MPDTSVSALDQRQQKLVENAQVALENGNWPYVIEATGHVLNAAPGCVEARRLQRIAQMRQFENKNRLVAKAMGGLSSTPFIFSSVTKNPHKALGNAEKILATDPMSSSALKLMADAAMALDYPETAAFAREAVKNLSPDDSGNLLELGEAWLAAGKPSEALTAADAFLRIKPLDRAGQNLMRKAAIAQSTVNGWGTLPVGGRTGGGSTVAVAEVLAGPPKISEEEKLRKLGKALAQVAAEPGHLSHYRAIVDAYRDLDRLTDAMAWVRKARALPAGALDIRLEKQESEINAALLEAQVWMAESVLVASPEDPEVQAKLEAVRKELVSFRFFEARRDVDRFPADLGKRFVFAKLCLERGQIDDAIGHFQASQKNPAFRLGSLAGLGRALKAKKQYDEAVAQFLIAKGEPGPMTDEKKDVLYQLAECYELLGRADQAIVEYKAIYAEDVAFRDVAKRINAHFNRS